MRQTASKQACNNFFTSNPAQTNGLSSQLSVPGNGKSALSYGKWDRTCRKRANARSTLPPFYKQCIKKAINMRQTASKQACNNFFTSNPAQTNGLSSQLSVPGNGKSALSYGKWDRTCRKRANAQKYTFLVVNFVLDKSFLLFLVIMSGPCVQLVTT